MDIAIGMIIGSSISIISILLTANHMISVDKDKNKPLHYDIEIKSSGKYVKGRLYLKKRRDKFYAKG